MWQMLVFAVVGVLIVEFTDDRKILESRFRKHRIGI